MELSSPGVELRDALANERPSNAAFHVYYPKQTPRRIVNSHLAAHSNALMTDPSRQLYHRIRWETNNPFGVNGIGTLPLQTQPISQGTEDKDLPGTIASVQQKASRVAINLAIPSEAVFGYAIARPQKPNDQE
jgi:hypothetical protein